MINFVLSWGAQSSVERNRWKMISKMRKFLIGGERSVLRTLKPYLNWVKSEKWWSYYAESKKWPFCQAAKMTRKCYPFLLKNCVYCTGGRRGCRFCYFLEFVICSDRQRFILIATRQINPQILKCQCSQNMRLDRILEKIHNLQFFISMWSCLTSHLESLYFEDPFAEPNCCLLCVTTIDMLQYNMQCSRSHANINSHGMHYYDRSKSTFFVKSTFLIFNR